jgi:hypothetical protein
MKNLLSLVAVLLLSLLTIFTGCSSPANTTPPSNTTSSPASIYVEIESCGNDPEGKIAIDDITVTAGTLDRDYSTPAAGKHLAGETCFLFSGNINNDYNEDCWVSYKVQGFDASGNQVSWTLDTGPLPGWGQVYIAAGSSMPFTLHLTWSDSVTDLLVSSQRTTRQEPSPSP